MKVNPTRALGALAWLIVVACGGGSGPDNPADLDVVQLSPVAGASQNGVVGQPVGILPIVHLSDGNGAKANATVTFSVKNGGGTITGGTATTDASGNATVGSWTLGTAPVLNSVWATYEGAEPASFVAIAQAGPAAKVSIAAGDGQTATVATALATKPAVIVTDTFGNPVSGTGVTFAVTAGAGTLTGASATSGTNGVATVGGWTLGNIAGANGVRATAPGTGLANNPITFAATGTAASVASITKIAGDNLIAAVGSLLSTPPSVRLADQFGNLVANQGVTFAVASGGGTITGAAQTSASTGVATLGSWTLGSTAGTNTVTASSGSATPVTFSATGTAVSTLPSIAGTWSGTWTDTRYNVSGVLSNVILTQSATTFGGTGAINVSSIGFGTVIGTATGTISGNTITFSFTAAGFGSGSGSLTGGNGSGSGSVTAGSFGSFTYTGTVTNDTIDGTFQFTSPTGGNGVMTLTKQ